MKTLLKCMVGSQAYGTSTPSSDHDYKGVYAQHPDALLGFGYKEQVDVTKDEVYFEVRRFIQLLQSANPTMLELLWIPEDCILEKHPAFDLLIAHKSAFLTQKCLHSFGGYATAQIKKARGLDKKMNWERNRVERKGPMDFCYAYLNGKTMPLVKCLEMQGLAQVRCGLVGLEHFRDTYALYYDPSHDMNMRLHGLAFEDSNSLRLSAVPKGHDALTVVYYNKDGYSQHCKDFREYTEWLEKRNTARYVDIAGHNQQIDGKNLLHCRRLLDVAIEIATEGIIRVRRPNADYLLAIRRGEVSLEKIIAEAEADMERLEGLFKNTSLPADCDTAFCDELLLEVRREVKF